jgi:hypothetical protein
MGAYKKVFTLKTLSKFHGLKETPLYEGLSFVLGCSVHRVKYDDIYITDYDFINLDDLEKKGLSMLFYRNKGVFNSQKVSNEMLKDEKLFKYALDSFKKECENVIKNINLKKELK